MQAQLPTNESERLAALRDLDILDTDAEPEFDELVVLAAALCSTPIGLVSLVDEDRQWFKASVGLSLRETPRSSAFCAHAILGDSVFSVEDATTDSRFAENPLVTSQPNIRFYAGIPVASQNGIPVGTLCVIDTVPRQLTPEQKNALEILGRQVNVRLELRTQRKALEQLLIEKQQMLDTLGKTQCELELANRRLKALAATDALTGLRNRRIFEERLLEEFRRAKRHGTLLCIAIIDIDNFKLRNDQHGHPAGDAALKQLSTILEDSVREYDLAVRYGGEEFAILLPETSITDAHLVMHRLLRTVHSTAWQHHPLTVSIGLAELDHVSDIDQSKMMKRADLALYAAKSAGKDRICCSDTSIAA